jgi:tetratricopeptide (TPR) repeat protein
MNSFKEIEALYIQDTSSPLYSILADYYFKLRKYTHVIKICKNGISNYRNDIPGTYIYAKALIMLGDFKKAEGLLKKIIKENPYNPQSGLLLIRVMEHLNRSPNSIIKYVNIMNKLFINHDQVIKLYSKYSIENLKTRKKKHTAPPVKSSIRRVQSNSFIVNERLATKTMYRLLVSQKKYNKAMDVLIQLKENSSIEPDYIVEQIKKIKNKLKDIK